MSKAARLSATIRIPASATMGYGLVMALSKSGTTPEAPLHAPESNLREFRRFLLVALARSSAEGGALSCQDRPRPLHPVLPSGGSQHRQRSPRGMEGEPVLRPPGLGDSVPRNQKCVRSEPPAIPPHASRTRPGLW